MKPEVIISFIAKSSGTCSFESALDYLQEQGMDKSTARDWLWEILALGHIRFTNNRDLTLPSNSERT